MTTSDDPNADHYAFFCGADMDPVAIRRRDGFERARFVSIASTTSAGAALPELAEDEIWGIVVRVPEDTALPDTPRITVTLRDGATAQATLLTTAGSAGTSAEILAQARYWELPVPYRNRLEALG